MLALFFSLIFFGGCLFAALRDIDTLTIPNWLNAWMAFLFIPACLVAAPGWDVVGSHVLVGALAFVISVALFYLGVFGGGDAKMIPAVMLWIGPAGGLSFMYATAFAGGILVVLVLIARKMSPQPEFAGFGGETLKKGEGVPYGVAIAAGAFAAGSYSPLLSDFLSHAGL